MKVVYLIPFVLSLTSSFSRWIPGTVTVNNFTQTSTLFVQTASLPKHNISFTLYLSFSEVTARKTNGAHVNPHLHTEGSSRKLTYIWDNTEPMRDMEADG